MCTFGTKGENLFLLKEINFKFHLDLLFLFIYISALPIAHVNAVQNISLALFMLVFFITSNQILFRQILKLKLFLFIILSFVALSLISIYFSIDYKETIKSIRSELIKPILIGLVMFAFTLTLEKKRLKYLFVLIFIALCVHTIINIVVWQMNGGWPFRAGGLLDNGGGERFGIWATYFFAMALALFQTQYKKYIFAFFLLAIVSIIANNTRATYVGCFIILISYFFSFYKYRRIKYIFLSIVIIIITIFTFNSKELPQRYNIYHIIDSLQYFNDYPLSQYDELIVNHNLDASVVIRVAMWKSVLLYREAYPFTPQGYGRFLYGKGIHVVFKNKPENIPYNTLAQAHNDYITVLFSLGIIGLVLFLSLLFYLLYISFYVFKYNQKYKYFAIFIFLGTLGFMSSMMFGSFFGDSEQDYFYFLYGIILAIYLKTRESISSNVEIYSSK